MQAVFSSFSPAPSSDAAKLLKKIPKTTIILYEFLVTPSFFYLPFQIESSNIPNSPFQTLFIAFKLSI